MLSCIGLEFNQTLTMDNTSVNPVKNVENLTRKSIDTTDEQWLFSVSIVVVTQHR
jgi:hypothetical protein